VKRQDALLVGAIVAVMMIIGVATSGCTDPGTIDPGSEVIWDGIGLNETGATEGGVSEVAQGLNQFGLDLYLELLNGSENLFISPDSLFTALSMTYEGARGNTAKEMADVLHLPDNDTVRRGSFARVQNRIRNGTSDYELFSPNKIWPSTEATFFRSFYDIIEDFYNGGIEELDYSDPEAARQIINQWVENQTKDRIKELLPEGSLGRASMVLTNAIYFLGDWLYRFNANETKEAGFTLSSGRNIKVPTMGMKVEGGLDYFEDDKLQALELPYSGGDLIMVVLLPRGPITELESTLSASYLNRIGGKMKVAGEVDVFLPRFEITTPTLTLREDLEDLGMKEAFKPGADFSGMTDNAIWVDNVYHKAYVRVDEEGTEAAAATAVVMENRSIEGDMPIVFRADHPFMFFIMHEPTGSILFMGKVEDPRS